MVTLIPTRRQQILISLLLDLWALEERYWAEVRRLVSSVYCRGCELEKICAGDCLCLWCAKE